MRTPADVTELIARRVRSSWQEEIADQELSRSLPWVFSVGKPTAVQLDQSLGAVRAWAVGIESFAKKYSLTVEYAPRRSSLGLKQTMPARIVVDSFEQAARVAGRLPELTRDRDRMARLRQVAAHDVTTEEVASVVSHVRIWSDSDVAVLVSALEWFTEHSGVGLTAREVPVPGMDSKWLTSSRQKEISLLLGRDTLGLTAGRPSRRNCRYLDPGHLDAGGRQFDVAAAGDVNRPEYLPELVIICENVDSAQQLPRRAGTIVFEGDGDAGASLITELDWVQQCPCVLYWGDMDVDGLSIVNTYRDRGLMMETILMDADAYLAFADRGVSVDRHGHPLRLHPHPHLPHLTSGETALLDLLCDPQQTGPRRIEQEQLPREVAVAQIDAAAERNLVRMHL